MALSAKLPMTGKRPDAAPKRSMPAGKGLTPDNTSALLNEIYDIYRTAALNKNYYGEMLARYQLRNTWLEIAIAIGTASSGVSGAVALLNKFEYGSLLWGFFTAIASLLAIAKPILQLNKQVERYSKLFAGHLENFMNLQLLVTKIRRSRKLTAEMIEQFERAELRFVELSRGDDPKTVRKLHERCERDVRQAIPDLILWYPKRRSAAAAGTVKRFAPPVASLPQQAAE
jgi:hypothetical protein